MVKARVFCDFALYTVDWSMDDSDVEQELFELLLKYSRKLPSFPDGRIDYSTSWEAPVVDIFVFVQNELLILKRSLDVRMYKERWHVIGGYIDETRPLHDIAQNELIQELGLYEFSVDDFALLPPINYFDELAKFQWTIYPIILELQEKPEIHLDWEHTTHVWITPSNLNEFDFVPGLDLVLEKVLEYREARKDIMLQHKMEQ